MQVLFLVLMAFQFAAAVQWGSLIWPPVMLFDLALYVYIQLAEQLIAHPANRPFAAIKWKLERLLVYSIFAWGGTTYVLQKVFPDNSSWMRFGNMFTQFATSV